MFSSTIQNLLPLLGFFVSKPVSKLRPPRISQLKFYFFGRGEEREGNSSRKNGGHV